MLIEVSDQHEPRQRLAHDVSSGTPKLLRELGDERVILMRNGDCVPLIHA